MNKLRNRCWGVGFVGLCVSTSINAALPVWTYSAPSPALVTVAAGGTATVQYTVTNQSIKSKNLILKATPGVSASACYLAARGSTCTLTLMINGSLIPEQGLHTGPVLCEQNNPNQCYQPNPVNVLNVVKGTNPPPVIHYTVSANGDTHVVPNPSNQQVNYNGTVVIYLSVAPGYVAGIASDTCGGSLSGTTYTTAPVTRNCSVNFISTPSFPVAGRPNHVFVVPGNGQAMISWTAPSNTGTGTIIGYTVTYGPTSGTRFDTAGCTATAPSLTCVVTGLTNGIAYTFAVSTITRQSGVNQTGPASLSSSITPINGLVASPSTLALSGLGGGLARTITLKNTSANPITLDTVPTAGAFNPALPMGTAISATTCNNNVPIPSGGSCTIILTPGAIVSSDNSSTPCTNGGAPVPSAINITANGNTVHTTAHVVVLGYGCQYQGGYVFSIDDTAPNVGSIGGKVVATTNQADAYPNGITWSPGSVYNNIWGIDDASTSSHPSPNASSTYPATFQTGQLNCDAANDGACATHNVQVFYNSRANTTYATGLCRQPLTGNSATACAGGSTCYSDWYLPSVCDLGPFGSGGNYPSSPGSQACTPGSTNIQNQLVSTNITNLSGYYWCSTENSGFPLESACYQYFDSSNSAQGGVDKHYALGVRCVRSLTY
ncbi:fibronectin type III domain-containing protein [Legionella bozemanae]|uniref:Fibronectin type-III domain-containing protein n=1 Tax=Legionella bozemanae TaxID=447 RepID=A0A0W0RXS0_LEGBO|nr:fibronectin type III domain-containing protein [Legionella bozemanae]KTC75922.1 hypothetical protein Lboz_0750 [Legionella bozemanae]STO35452.1 Fibronectin type III domain [Legionella bozemanae]